MCRNGLARCSLSGDFLVNDGVGGGGSGGGGGGNDSGGGGGGGTNECGVGVADNLETFGFSITTTALKNGIHKYWRPRLYLTRV